MKGRRVLSAAAEMMLAAVVVGILLVTAAYAVVMPDLWTTPRSLSLSPGAGIAGQLENINREVGLVNLAGNIAMFVPVGFLAVLSGRLSPAYDALAGAAMSAAIETAQYFVGRNADIDDVLLNSAGCGLGCLVAVGQVRSLHVCAAAACPRRAAAPARRPRLRAPRR